MTVLGRAVLCVLAACIVLLCILAHRMAYGRVIMSRKWNQSTKPGSDEKTRQVVVCGRLGIEPRTFTYTDDPKEAYGSMFPWAVALGYKYNPSVDSSGSPHLSVPNKSLDASDSSHIPYVVNWLRSDSSDSPPSDVSSLSWRCGGSLVSLQTVITAAHCLVGNSGYVLTVARLGEINLDDTVDDGVTPADYEVASWVAHPNYTLTPTVNDIAVVRLKNIVIFTDFIQPICLPIHPSFRTEDFTGWFTEITGWGTKEFGGPKSAHLLNGRVKIVDQKVCREAYKHWNDAVIDNRVVCASGNGIDTCQGDSGGPMAMIIPEIRTFYLYGVVSYGVGCGNAAYPGVYTRVSEFIDFIVENLV